LAAGNARPDPFHAPPSRSAVAGLGYSPGMRSHMPAEPDAHAAPGEASLRDRRRGMLWGLLGVIAFSLTLPATRLAVAYLDPVFVGLGRAVVAAALAAAVLLGTRARRPDRRTLAGLVLVALGVVVGFPLFSAYAMRYVPASHGAVVVGLLPLATAVAGALFAHERPSPRFWGCALVGSGVVGGFAVWKGGGALHRADLLLVAAVVSAAVGYAEGARLARSLGGWQVISWALVIAAPIVAVPTWLSLDSRIAAAPWTAWAAFAYVSAVSMFLGFFAWYKGLALGGIAAVGQLQLLQPFFTLFASAVLLHETLDAPTFIAAALVVATIAAGRRRR